MTRARQAGLGMLGLGIGYFLWYIPYAALTKALSSGLLPASGLLPGMDTHVGGLVLLPAAALGTLVGAPLFLTITGWWRYIGTRPVFGRVLRFPSRTMIVAGFFMALVIATTTLNYTFAGVSILFMLLMMRAGVLILSPVVDTVRRRRVRVYSWAALGFSLLAVVAALSDVNSYHLTVAAGLSLAGYFGGYLGRFEIMSRIAKTGDKQTDRRYFAEEAISSAVWQVMLCAVVAVAGIGQVSSALREGFTTFLFTPAVLPAFGIGLLYSALYVFGTLIYLDPREYTWCVPVNRCASLLSGLVASFGLVWLAGIAAPGSGQFIATGFIFVAILALCYPAIRKALRSAPVPVEQSRLMFVCGGNAIRSPMAAAIAKAELATLGHDGDWLVTSAGVAVKQPGAPIAPLATTALRELKVPVPCHTSRELTAAMCLESRAVFCMTTAHREAILALAPEARDRIYCLDPAGDIAEPAKDAYQSYVDCARRLQVLVRQRLDDLDSYSGLAVAGGG